MKEEKQQPKTELTKQELILVQQVLFNSRWNGQEWEGTIKPLINKLAKMADLVE